MPVPVYFFGMRGLLQILIVTTLANPYAHAVLGPSIPNSQRPHAICAVEFLSATTGEREEICSAVVISDRYAMTAGHCAANALNRPHRLICRGEADNEIAQVVVNPTLSLSNLRRDNSERRFDSAVVRMRRPISATPLPFVRTLKQQRAVLRSARHCGIFGFGRSQTFAYWEGISLSALVPTSTVVEAQADERGPTLVVIGLGGYNSGFVEPGDSGGSLSCFLSLTGWIHVAQVSGRSMELDGYSFLAPAFFINGVFDQLKIESSPNYRRSKFYAEDLASELHSCRLKLDRLGAPPHVPKINTVDQCEAEFTRRLVLAVQVSGHLKAKVKTYSLVELTQEPRFLDLNFGKSPERLLNSPNSFSTVDHELNQFKIERIEGPQAIGDLQLFGYSANFPCLENILCDAGVYKNVRVRLEDLSL